MESMKVCNLLRSRSFLAFALGHFNIKIKIMVYDYHQAYESEVLCGFSMLRGNKILCIKSGWNAQHGHHAHNAKKSSSPEPVGGFSQSLVCSIRDLSPS